METKNFEIATTERGKPDADILFLCLAGLVESKDHPHIKHHVETAARLGCLAVAPDPPGIWGSGENTENYTTTNYIQSVKELIKYYNRKTIIMGHSLGGRVATVVAIEDHAAETPQVIGVVPAMSGDTFAREDNFYERVEEWQNNGSKSFSVDMPEDPRRTSELELPYSFSADAQQYNAREGLDTLTIPKFYIAGRYDSVVSPSLVKETFEVAPEPKEYYEVNSGHHYRRHPKIVNQVSSLVANFIERTRNQSRTYQ
ncbi:alpha/beta hydrolase [Candidatus Saccharibacteria bacterium]|nr:alpha/beta hydrolase [Candidatus Saccharibacteria bacterium]